MHELGLALDVVDTVTRRSEGARVTRVVLEVGALAAVLPDALRFCFDLACEGTVAEGARLEILPRCARARCRTCAAEVEVASAWERCPCGGGDLEWVGGSELRILEMEVTPCA